MSTEPQSLILYMIHKYLKNMENIKSASPETLRAYSNDLVQAFGACKIDTNPTPKMVVMVLTMAIRDAQNKWGKLSPASRNRKAATLKSFFNYLFDEELIPVDLAMKIQAPKVPKKIPNFISVDEVLSVLKSFEKDETREKVLFLLLYGAGLRVSEACNLKWSNLDLAKKTIRVEKGKGGKDRIVAAPKILIENLKRLKLKQKNDVFIFGETPLHTRAAYSLIRTRGVKSGLLRPLHPHALRHSFATHLLSSGANLRSLQELLGHQSLQATEKYTHLSLNQLARTLEKSHPFGDKK